MFMCKIGVCVCVCSMFTIQFSIQFSFIFRHTCIFDMHNTEVQNKIIDSGEKITAIVFSHENAHALTTSSAVHVKWNERKCCNESHL